MDPKIKKIAIGAIGLLVVILVIVSLVASAQPEPEQPDEPLSSTSELNNDPSYLSSQAIAINVTPPEGEDEPPENTTESPSTTTPRQTTPRPVENPPTTTKPVENPPTTINPGTGSEFSVTSYESDSGSIGSEQTLAQHGWWALDSTTKNNGASTIRINARLLNNPGDAEYRMIQLLDFSNGGSVYIGLQSNISSLGGARGAFFEMYGANAAESPSGNVIGNPSTPSILTSRLVDWTAGSDYEYTIRKNNSRSNASNTWWEGYVRIPQGTELLIGSIRTPTSLGQPITRTTYLERWGEPTACGGMAPAQARFFNLRNDGRAAQGVSVNIRTYTNCNNVYGFDTYSTNGYVSKINRGS